MNTTVRFEHEVVVTIRQRKMKRTEDEGGDLEELAKNIAQFIVCYIFTIKID